MSGDLANYKPRRKDEYIFYRDPNGKFSDIETIVDYWFWFRQRILQYGANVVVISPKEFAHEIKQEHEKAFNKYSQNLG